MVLGVYVLLFDIVIVIIESGFSMVQCENGIMLIVVLGDLDDEDVDCVIEVNIIIDEEILLFI